MNVYDKTEGTVFNIQRFSTDDGSGIRTCVFLKGCPLRCEWCHNPESQGFAPEIAYYAESCISCRTCAHVCKEDCHVTDGIIHEFRRERCVRCGACAEACPSGSLRRVGERRTCAEVMSIIKRDKIFYGADGGVTVTGGEPMSQFEFTYALAEESRREGISFAVETSGYAPTEDFLKIAPLTDVFLYDCKASSEEHTALTGVADELILQNLDMLCKIGANVVLRCPIVQGGNLNDAFIKKITDIAEKYPAISEIQLMPYHKTGLHKASRLGNAPQREFSVPDDAVLAEINRRIKSIRIKTFA